MQEDSRLWLAERPGTQRPGGRTARNRQAVLEAALAELAEVGYADTCVEKIAARAGVSPSTVYRRWRNLDGVLQDLAGTFAQDVIDSLPDSGDLRTDLYWLADQVARLIASRVHGAIIGSLVTAGEHTPAARQTLAAILLARMEHTQRLIVQAIDRGDIPHDTDRFELIHFLIAPIYYRRYITGEPIDQSLLHRTAEVTTLAARNGLLAPRGA